METQLGWLLHCGWQRIWGTGLGELLFQLLWAVFTLQALGISVGEKWEKLRTQEAGVGSSLAQSWCHAKMKPGDGKQRSYRAVLDVPRGILALVPGRLRRLSKLWGHLQIPFIHQLWEVNATTFHCLMAGKAHFRPP